MHRYNLLMLRGRRRSTDESSDVAEEKKRLNRDSLKAYARIFAYTKPYRFWLFVSAIALVISSLLGLVLPLVVRDLLDNVLILEQPELLNRLAIILFGVFALQAVLSFVNHLGLAFVGERTVADIRVELFAHLQRLSLTFYADNRTGGIVSRIGSDVQLLQTAVAENLVVLLRQLVLLIGAAFMLFRLNWQLTLVILTGIPIMSLTIVYLGRRIRIAAKRVQGSLADASNVVEETTSGIRIVKSFAREPHEIGRYRAAIQEVFEAAMYGARIKAILGPFIGFIAFASITTTLWFGSYQVLQGQLTPGELVAYLVYTMLIATPVSTLASLYAQFQSAIGATERVFELMDTPSDIVEREDAVALPPVLGSVVFEDIAFSYNDGAKILDGVSFSAETTTNAGQVIALVGPSGAGKSTLVNLIPRFYDVDHGRILIDGIDLRDVTLASLREQIGIVPQETILFSDSVANNIRYGRLDATDAEIEAAARAANAHDFIVDDLPNGYATLVGERGVKLSGGQRQRVAIARAILKNPRILILDEATSSLDSESERLVQDALERLMAGRTSFVIAHRLSTIINADRILVLEQGRLVEQGTHHELLQNVDGLYHRLHSIQFSQDDSQLTV